LSAMIPGTQSWQRGQLRPISIFRLCDMKWEQPWPVLKVLTILLAVLQNLGQVNDTVANEVVLLRVLVQTGHVEREGILGFTIVHKDIDLLDEKERGVSTGKKSKWGAPCLFACVPRLIVFGFCSWFVLLRTGDVSPARGSPTRTRHQRKGRRTRSSFLMWQESLSPALRVSIPSSGAPSGAQVGAQVQRMAHGPGPGNFPLHQLSHDCRT